MARKNSDVGRVILEGALTIRTAEATYAKLLEAASLPAVEIDCSGATEVDVSLIQLIVAARASARQGGRGLTLAQPADGALREALQRGGFLAAGADPATADQAFWL
jgi:anti-anti-sigma regulatory factor